MFQSDRESFDTAKHPITFRFQALKRMLKLREGIEVIIEGYAESQGRISEFIDLEENVTNTMFITGNMLAVSGHKIKLDGADPLCGVYFVPVEDPSKAVKVTRIGENSASHVSGIAPDTGYILNMGHALYLT